MIETWHLWIAVLVFSNGFTAVLISYLHEKQGKRGDDQR